jgi:hypothetical protein
VSGLAALIATLLRFRARACVVLACVAAMLCAATIASATPSTQTKTRVWDFSFAQPLNTWLKCSASPRTHPENQLARAKPASGSPHAARGAAEAVKVGEYTLTRTVAGKLAERPYLNSPLTLREIMAAGKPISDPGGVAGALRWDVPGAFRGSAGTWQLVVDPQSNTVLHWLFNTAPKVAP